MFSILLHCQKQNCKSYGSVSAIIQVYQHRRPRLTFRESEELIIYLFI